MTRDVKMNELLRICSEIGLHITQWQAKHLTQWINERQQRNVAVDEIRALAEGCINHAQIVRVADILDILDRHLATTD